MNIDDGQISKAAATLRCLSVDMIEKAASGHPGAAMGMADIAAVLWLRFLKFDPSQPAWADRDRLVFSGGHASALLYSLLHLSGAGLSMDDLRNFRQLGSRTPGHPERGVTPGVEVTTGPLGQGFAMAVGMALAERFQAARDNVPGHEIVSHRTWCFLGDGDMQEGISHEAASLAGLQKLDRLVCMYDSNGITIEGSTALSSADDTRRRFESYGWKVFEADGHDIAAITAKIRAAMRTEGKPSLIIFKTEIGHGAPAKGGTAGCHGAPLGAEEAAAAKKALGFDPAQSFAVPEEAAAAFSQRARAMRRVRLAWDREFAKWEEAAGAEKAAVRKAADALALPEGLRDALPVFAAGESVSTRAASGSVMNAIAPLVPSLVGGSADLAPSNKTYLKGFADMTAETPAGRNMRFGIRELGMAAVLNGMAAHGSVRPFGATFFVFSDYCRPAVRLAALMKLPVVFVFSHDSFYVGEDGATHQPVEQLASWRIMPDVLVLRPADANETAAAWMMALERKDGPTLLLLSRQNLPVLPPADPEGVRRGGYVAFDESPFNLPRPVDLSIVATGSEVSVAVEAAKRLVAAGRHVRVVSMPSPGLFLSQSQLYRDSVLPPSCGRRLIVEAGVRNGWEVFAEDRERTAYITLDRFGLSGKCSDLAKEFGFTPENVVAQANILLAR